MRRIIGAVALGSYGPGSIVERYVAGTAAMAIALVGLALVALLSLFHFVEQLPLVGQGGYGVQTAFSDMVLTAPSRALQVAPVSMLLGSLLAFGLLARNAELTVMLSLGISEQRIIRSVMLLVLPATIVLLVVSQYLIPSGQRLAYERRSAALASTFQPDENGAWAHSGGQYLNVRQLDAAANASGIDIYAFTSDGNLSSVIHADHADPGSGRNWTLTGVTRTLTHDSVFAVDHPATLTWHAFLTGDAMRDLFLPVDSIPPVELYRQIRSAARLGENVPRLQQAFWGLIGIPFSMLAMTMLVASIAFQPARMQSTAQDLTRAMAFSIAYSLAQQILDRLGLLLGLAPAKTALALPLLLMSFAVWLFYSRLRPR